MADLENEFNKLMRGLCERMIHEVNFKSLPLYEMIEKYGGVGAAKQLLNAHTISDGYALLFEKRRLDLTVEAIVLDHPQYHGLFTEKELATASRRLGRS